MTARLLDTEEVALPFREEVARRIRDEGLRLKLAGLLVALAAPRGHVYQTKVVEIGRRTEKRGDAEQAMGWFADSMRLRDVINLVTSIEIPLPDSPDTLDENDELLDGPTILPK